MKYNACLTEGLCVTRVVYKQGLGQQCLNPDSPDDRIFMISVQPVEKAWQKSWKSGFGQWAVCFPKMIRSY